MHHLHLYTTRSVDLRSHPFADLDCADALHPVAVEGEAERHFFGWWEVSTAVFICVGHYGRVSMLPCGRRFDSGMEDVPWRSETKALWRAVMVLASDY